MKIKKLEKKIEARQRELERHMEFQEDELTRKINETRKIAVMNDGAVRSLVKCIKRLGQRNKRLENSIQILSKGLKELEKS